MRLCVLSTMLLAACAAPNGSGGTLLLVGGGLDDDARPVYERLLAARMNTAPGIVVATAATGPQEVEATDKTEALRAWAPGVAVEVVLRETSAADTVAALARASSVFFTGGDQQRITARYRPEDAPGPEWHALQQLLARGGVLGGGSAGCAMMGERMLVGGRSEQALGIPAAAADGDEPLPLGPRIGPGMGFLPGVLTDSHFFERDRLGRLVAALGQGPDRLGLGVGEDAAVEVDVAARTVTGVTVAETLLVDATFARQVGSDWVGLRARLIGPGDEVALAPLGSAAPVAFVRAPAIAHEVPVVEPGQNRQLASWRLFRQAVPGAGVLRLRLAGWSVLAQAEAAGVVVFEVRVGGA
jgi:cyanophycinase